MKSYSAKNKKESAAASPSSAEHLRSPAGSRDRLVVFGIWVVAVLVTLPPQVFPPQQVIAKHRVLDTSWQLSMPMLLGGAGLYLHLWARVPVHSGTRTVDSPG